MGGEEDKKRYSPQPRGHLWQDQGGQALPQSGHSLEGRMLRQKLQHWVPDVKSRLIGKDPDAGKDEGRRRGVTEDETVGWHHRLNGHESE